MISFQNIELRTFRLFLRINGSKVDIVLRDNNLIIGYVNLIESDYINDLNGIKIEFNLDNEYKGIGIMTEAIRELVRYLMLEVKCDYINLYNLKSNLDSKRVIIKTKFKLDKEEVIDGKTYEIYLIKRDYYLSLKERVQLFDIDGNRLDKFIYRGERHDINTYIGVVDIIVKNVKYNKYLVTRRDLNKETYPGFWEISGGAVDFNEDLNVAARREVKEETGIDLINLVYLYKNAIGSMIYFTYIGECNCSLDSVELQDGETIDYKWISAKEFVKMFNSKLVPDKQKLRLKPAIEKYIR